MLPNQLEDNSFWAENQSGRNIKQVMDNQYMQHAQVAQSVWSEADLDRRFVAGDQMVWDLYTSSIPAYRRKNWSFNHLRRTVNMISGHQRKNRKSIVALPVEHDDEEAASAWTEILFSVNGKNQAQEYISDAFERGALVCGNHFLHTYLDYTKDKVSGDIKIDSVPITSVLIDSHYKKRDLSDCRFIWRRKWMSKDAILALSPESSHEMIQNITPSGNRDGKFPYQEESFNYAITDLIPYDEYWYKDYRDAIFVTDPRNGRNREWKGSDEDLKLYLSVYPFLKKKKEKVPTVNLATLVDGKVIYDGRNPLRIDRYPFVSFIGYFDPELANYSLRSQGVARGLRDAQFLYNRRKIIELDILESQVNSGFKYKPTSLVNPSDIFLSGQGAGIALKAEAMMTDVEAIQSPMIPPSTMAISESLGQEIIKIAGTSEELLGMASDDISGVQTLLRQGAALTTLQILFDNLDMSVKQLGEIEVDIVQNNYEEDKIERILGKKAPEEFSHQSWLEYDIRIEEGVNTATQRQMEFIQLLKLRELGLPITPEALLKAATVQNKPDLIKQMEQANQQQQQMAMAQAQSEMQLRQAQIKDLEASAVEKQGLGIERMSRLQENQAQAEERRAQAIHDRQSGVLDMVRAAKEMQGIDLQQVQQTLALIQSIQALEAAEQNNAGQQAQISPGGGIPTP